MDTWTVRPLYEEPPGVDETSEGGERSARLSSLTAAQCTTLSTASCSTAQQCAGEGEPDGFAGSSLPQGKKTTCECI